MPPKEPGARDQEVNGFLSEVERLCQVRGWRSFRRNDGRGPAPTGPADRFVLSDDRAPNPPGARTDCTTRAAHRLLVAHLETVSAVLIDLPPAALLAASDAAVELVKGVLAEDAAGFEASTAISLAGEARQVAESALTDPHLSSVWVARRLSVSERTLQRAFRAEGETLMTYVRRRRIESALAELIGTVPRPSVIEVAARWGFSDSSHLIRVCRKLYGQTPTQYIRAHTQAEQEQPD
ncbi:helix-turn-helix transcriptional regulator [Actinoplanes sp. M2I2]|uniref:helix-turn-helix transcriptional regulator n=1 Tax=Actinoplanes sp. M2I2 TaxID=1734444 RepID=UPI002020DBF9|nr:helix-turn-helix transcriptional regulator [Actinoplanes sp. M2I2]